MLSAYYTTIGAYTLNMLMATELYIKCSKFLSPHMQEVLAIHRGPVV